MAKLGSVVQFDNGEDLVPALVVKDNGDETFGLFVASPVEGNHVVFENAVPEGEGGKTFKAV